MTDEELIDRLRDVYVRDTIRLTAADRIEQLVADVAGWISNAQAARGYQVEAEYRLEATDSALAKAVEALREMHKKSAWLRGEQAYREFARFVEKTARAVLAELEKPE